MLFPFLLLDEYSTVIPGIINTQNIFKSLELKDPDILEQVSFSLGRGLKHLAVTDKLPELVSEETSCLESETAGWNCKTSKYINCVNVSSVFN